MGVLAVAGFLCSWAVTHHGDQNAEVRQPGTGARRATPDLVWPEGEPQGGLERSPWAQAVRARDLTFAVAFNARDVSDATFAELYPAPQRQELAQQVLDQVSAARSPRTTPWDRNP